MKSKKNSQTQTNKLATEINPKEFLDQEGFVRQSLDWLRQHGVLSDYDINAIILNTLVSSRKILDVSMNIDKNQKHIDMSVLLGRWSYLFSNHQKIVDGVLKAVHPIIQNYYTISVNVRLYKEKSLI